MGSLTPVQRTMRELRNRGMVCAVVERFNQHAGPHGVRQDLFGIIDIIAVRPGLPTLGVQVCSATDHARRRTKAIEEARLITWLAAGNRFEVWSWKKTKRRWQLRREELTGVQVMNERGAA